LGGFWGFRGILGWVLGGLRQTVGGGWGGVGEGSVSVQRADGRVLRWRDGAYAVARGRKGEENALGQKSSAAVGAPVFHPDFLLLSET
jgi:hypothetical protein